MFCSGTPYVQIGSIKFSNFQNLSISIQGSPGSTSASFQIYKESGDATPPQIGYVGIFDGSGRKLFAGVITGFSKSEQGSAEIFAFSAKDFTYFARWNVIKNYQPETPSTFQNHAGNLVQSSNAYDPNRDFNAFSLPSWPDATELYFSCSEKHLIEAMSDLCSLFGLRWMVDFGDFQTIDELLLRIENGGNVANFLIFDQNGIPGSPISTISLPNVTACFASKYYDVNYTIDWSTVQTASIVLGKGGDLSTGQVGESSYISENDILPNATAKFYKLHDLCKIVNKVEIWHVARILDFTPSSGPSGTLVTITGLYFADATKVFFNGIEGGGFAVVDEHTVTATVPPGATTGKIEVETLNEGTAKSALDFTVE